MSCGFSLSLTAGRPFTAEMLFCSSQAPQHVSIHPTHAVVEERRAFPCRSVHAPSRTAFRQLAPRQLRISLFLLFLLFLLSSFYVRRAHIFTPTHLHDYNHLHNIYECGSSVVPCPRLQTRSCGILKGLSGAEV